MAVVITAAQDSAWPPRVIVSATGLTLGDTVTIYRVVNGQRTIVRGADHAVATDTSMVYNDGEYPFGVPVSYAVNVNGVDAVSVFDLNGDGTFETGVGSWAVSPANGTFASSTTHVHSGTKAGLLTADASLLGVGALTDGASPSHAPAGLPYTFSAWLYSVAGLTGKAQLKIEWFDNASHSISTNTEAATIPAATFTQFTMIANSPSNAVTAHCSINLTNSPASGTAIWVDDVTVTVLAVTAPVTYSLPGGKVALSDPITGLAVETTITAWPQKDNPRTATRFVVGGRTTVVSAPRGSSESSVELMTETETARQQMIALLDGATSGIVLIRQPGGYFGVDGTFAVLADSEARAAQDGHLERRLWTLDLVESDGWAPALTDGGWTLADIQNAYTGLTLGDLANDFDSLPNGFTLLDIARHDWGNP